MVRGVTNSPLVRAGVSLRLRALDARDALRGRHDPRVPPRRMNFVGLGDFVGTGDEFLGHFVELGGLEPSGRVLDVGCGIGRMARPLAGYLSSDGAYDGFDINAEGIAWCQPRYRDRPNFRFRHADVHNKLYNPRGTLDASSFAFPYDDDAFDLVFATSVFTHLTQAETEHYLDECARVAAPSGRLLLTFFVLDGVARQQIARGTATLPFRPLDERTAVVDPEVPEQAIAYDGVWLRATLAARGLHDIEIHPGGWSGRAPAISYQDIVVARG